MHTHTYLNSKSAELLEGLGGLAVASPWRKIRNIFVNSNTNINTHTNTHSTSRSSANSKSKSNSNSSSSSSSSSNSSSSSSSFTNQRHTNAVDWSVLSEK